MIIKRWDTTANSGAGDWVEHYPKTIATQLFNTTGTTAIFDSYNKIKPDYLPNSVFDSLRFFCTANVNTVNADAVAEAFKNSIENNRSVIGYYFLATSRIALSGQSPSLRILATRSFERNVTAGTSTELTGDTSNLTVGMTISGTGITTGTTIASITSPTKLVMSGPATSAGTSNVSFSNHIATSINVGEEYRTLTKTASLTNGSTTVALDATGLSVGMRISYSANETASGLPTGVVTVATIAVDKLSITISAAANANVDRRLIFEPAGVSMATVNLEIGDWYVITNRIGGGTSGSPYVFTLSVVNNTYELMGGATATTTGSPGLVPSPTAGQQLRFLRGDGTWVVPTDTTYSIATTSTAGLVELAHNKITTAITIETAGNTADRYYGVRLNNTNQMIVNVPWENTTYSEATTTAAGLVEITYAKQTSAKEVEDQTTTDGRFYGITLNNNSQAIVNVPWENTTYAKATTSSLGLVETAHADLENNPTITATTTNGRYYGVRLNQAQQMVVNVPWENTQYTAGVGLELDSEEFSLTQPHVVSVNTPAESFQKNNTLWFDI